jgi:cysteinyl-tRNA synthetase
MDHDLDTPPAIGVLFKELTTANSAADSGDTVAAATAAATVRHLARAVGLELGADQQAIPDEVAALVAERDAARASKDWARGDALRHQLGGLGWVVKDTPGGTVVSPGRPGGPC